MITYLIQDHEINFTRQAMNAAHQAFPREFAEWNLALFQKGKAVLPGVTVREIRKPYTTTNDNPETRWPPRLGDPGFDILKDLEQKERERQQTADAIAGADNNIAVFDGSPAPQPVDAGGEWPRWLSNGGLCLYRFDSEQSCTVYWSCGSVESRSTRGTSYKGYTSDEVCKPITPTQAATWLRANGHEAEAAKIEGPVANARLVGARVWVGRDPESDQWVTLADGSVVAPHIGKWVTCDCGAEWIVQTKREITGTPAAKEALASLARWMEVGGE